MEQPKNSGGQENNGVAEAEAEKKDSNNPMPNPRSNEGNGEEKKPETNGIPKDEIKLKQEHNSDSNRNIIDVKDNGNGSDRSNNKSASPPSRSRKSVRWSEELVMETEIPRSPDDRGSNPYVSFSSVRSDDSSSFNIKNTMDTVKDVLGRWGRKVGEATRKAEDFAGNTWQHLKTSPSFADAALGRLAQGTKVLAEGGYEKIFRQTFETVPEEQLQNSYACYLSTSAGPVMGVLYVSTEKLAFCSDNPLSYKVDDKTEWSFYKVVIPLHQLKAVNPSTSRSNTSEKYIQVISIDNHEFWYMGFLNYDGAVKCLQDLLQFRYLQSV